MIINETDEVISSEITFSEYAFACQLMGAKYTAIPMKNERYDIPAIANNINKKTKIIFIANPNNPTGTIIYHDELKSLLEHTPKHVAVVIDEAYAEYVNDNNYPNTRKLQKTFPNLILLRTFSKLFGLAGLRIGYAIADKNIIQDLHKVKQPFNINGLALQAAFLALNNTEHIANSIKKNTEQKNYLYTALDTISDIHYIPSHANFICIKLACKADIVCQYLLDAGIIVRNLSSFGMPYAIRVSIGKPEDNQKFIQKLKAAIKSIYQKNRLIK